MAVAQDLAHHAATSRWCHADSSRRDRMATIGCPSSRSSLCGPTRHSLDRHTSSSPEPISERKMKKEKLWLELISDPSHWWDHRPEKVNPRFPDFKHKRTGQSLWLVDKFTPPWVAAELATMPPSLLQSHVFSWNVRFRRHLKAEDYQKILNLFHQMQEEGMMPDKFTFVPVLNACSNLRSLEEGRHVHEQIIQRGCETDVYVANCLVDMYAKCGSIDDAWTVFDKMLKRDVVSWNAIIGGYVKNKRGLKALEIFRVMQQEGVEPDAVTIMGVLNACASVTALEEGRRVHEQIIRRGRQSDVYIATCLVDMYAKCGSIEDAWSVFNKMEERNVVSWSAMIVGYVKFEQGLKALELFRKMQQEGVEPNNVTFLGALNACASVGALEEGRRVHEQIVRRGYQSDVYVASSLVDMYAKCGSIEDAWSVFKKMRERNVVSWSAMILGYAKSEQGVKALELFQRMQQEGLEPNTVTFIGVLNACASVAALEEGRRVHEQITLRGCESDVHVANCLVDMYAKSMLLIASLTCMPNAGASRMLGVCSTACKNVVWFLGMPMIGGCVKSEQELKALELFQTMQQQGVEPNTVTFVEALKACASVAALQEGRRVHKQIIQRGCQSHVYVANCLIDMYAKCGSINDARGVFDKMQGRDVISWSAMIWGYAMHGQSKKAIELFQRMGKEGIEINQITFTCLLSACSHGGLLKEGLRYFNTMTSHHNVLPTTEHYACMVDLLGRAGRLDEAEELTKRIAMGGNTAGWKSLLSACRIHGNIEMAELAAKWCWELEPEKSSAHVLLSNIYATAGKWDRDAAIGK